MRKKWAIRGLKGRNHQRTSLTSSAWVGDRTKELRSDHESQQRWTKGDDGAHLTQCSDEGGGGDEATDDGQRDGRTGRQKDALARLGYRASEENTSKAVCTTYWTPHGSTRACTPPTSSAHAELHHGRQTSRRVTSCCTTLSGENT